MTVFLMPTDVLFQAGGISAQVIEAMLWQSFNLFIGQRSRFSRVEPAFKVCHSELVTPGYLPKNFHRYYPRGGAFHSRTVGKQVQVSFQPFPIGYGPNSDIDQFVH